MAIPLTINGVTFQYPQQFDRNWGPTLTNWSSAVTSGMLQKAGGSFTLTAEVDFGATYGLKAPYFKSAAAGIASTGILRLANASSGVVWRNQLGSADLALTVNSSNQLTFNGTPIGATTSLTDGHILVGNVSNQPADVAMTGDIAITNLGVTSIGSGVIVNADVNASAAIAVSKLATLTASRAVVLDGSGLLSAATTTATEIGYVNGVTSAIQTQLNNITGTLLPTYLPLGGGTMTGVLNMGSNKITSLSQGTTSSDAATFGQLPSGTTNKIAKFTGTTSVGNSALTDDGSTITSAEPLRVSITLSGTTTTPVISLAGSNGGIAYVIAQSTRSSAFGTASDIASMSTSRGETHDFHVSGRATGKVFVDKVLVVIDDSGNASSPNVYATAAIGSPVARTYTVVSGALKLLMSGNVTTYDLGVLDHYSS